MPSLEGMRSRTHTIQVLTRLYRDKPAPSNITKRMSLFDDAEQHQGVSDIYVIVGGSGTVIVGGEIEKREYRPSGGPGSMLLPGEFVGQPIVGGRSYKVKAGDILNIPPDTAHHPQPGPDGLTYFLVKVNVGLYPWSLSR
jgi:mannose-6-phosphate isomerase-like protein (cupin superfamily)